MVNSWECGLFFINPVSASQNEVEGLGMWRVALAFLEHRL